MAVHDAYARVTPYELLFPAPDFPDQRFPAVESEAVARGTDLTNPAAFATCGAVQGILADLRPEDDGPALGEEPAQASGHAHILYFAFQLWRTAQAARAADRSPDWAPEATDDPLDQTRPTVALLSRATVRSLLLLDADPLTSGWEAGLEGRAGYLQLPQHMVWAEEPGAERPESVDGFFWSATGRDALHVAAVTGMRPGRPGYGFVPVPPQPLVSLSDWTASPAREDGPDFAANLPGGEIDGLLGIRTPAEVFKLLAFALEAFALERWARHSTAATAADLEASPDRPPAQPGAFPKPTQLPYVVL